MTELVGTPCRALGGHGLPFVHQRPQFGWLDAAHIGFGCDGGSEKEGEEKVIDKKSARGLGRRTRKFGSMDSSSTRGTCLTERLRERPDRR